VKSLAEVYAALPDCDICQNMRKVIDPDTNQAIHCRCARPAFIAWKQEKIYNSSGLTQAQRAIRLEALPRQDTEVMQAAYRFKREKSGFWTITGEPGTGKTTAMLGVVNYFALNGWTAFYESWVRLIEKLKSSFGEEAPDISAYWDYLLECDVLAIDNIEYAKRTEWTNAKLFELVDRRYQLAQEDLKHRKLTIVASNVDLATYLADVPAIYQRLTTDGALYTIIADKGMRKMGI
jgi:DNA replication protein DnaC